ncbi:YIP1 family protein [Flavobacterium sediminilitoris]|uniref:YIP1 family protein n=1 Tax=Flavobacterium sediminilitoris TaxID=2024526 RepID=A0ABY4HN72_9FLAO|nr:MULTISPECIES: Yip1 family protein [Flavobacterium]UOX33721.1 YIP1 family protein [Flavobacterium sediminilitoris]
MEEHFSEFEEKKHLTNKELFSKLVSAPQDFFEYIIKNKYEESFKLLLVLAGISNAFDRASMRDLGDTKSLIYIIINCIFFGSLFGWITYSIYSSLLSWTGKWIGGKGNKNTILKVLAYASIPSIIGTLIVFLQIGIYGAEIFKSDGEVLSDNIILNIVFYLSLFLEFGFGLWTLFLYVIGISKAQQFSIWKAILNLFLSLFVIIIPIMLIFFILNR